jgi:hypothetical protein
MQGAKTSMGRQTCSQSPTSSRNKQFKRVIPNYKKYPYYTSQLIISDLQTTTYINSTTYGFCHTITVSDPHLQPK